MEAAIGFGVIGLFLLASMTGQVSVLVALVLVPLLSGLAAGHGAALGPMIMAGIGKVAPVGAMIVFAILYFGLMMDAGLFRPVIAGMVRMTRGDPLRVVLATAVLTMCVSLDGDGATTFLITLSAMLPLYEKLGMSRLVLSGTVALAAGVMNMLPWGGPTARAMAVLQADAGALFLPVLPAMAAGIGWVLLVAVLFGLRERRRLGVAAGLAITVEPSPSDGQARPWLFWFNATLTVALIAALFLSLLPLPALFLVALAVALMVNHPRWQDQQRQLAAHGANVTLVAAMIFAAGAFTGILTGTGMIDAMAGALVTLVPTGWEEHLPLLVALTSMPLSLALTPDAYYFGVLPMLAKTAAALGHDPVVIGRAAILGQMTTGFPLSPLTASTFILIGMSGVSLGRHQRFIFPWAFGTTLVMTLVALATGAFMI